MLRIRKNADLNYNYLYETEGLCLLLNCRDKTLRSLRILCEKRKKRLSGFCLYFEMISLVE